jgi:hypothetical protein
MVEIDGILVENVLLGLPTVMDMVIVTVNGHGLHPQVGV